MEQAQQKKKRGGGHIRHGHAISGRHSREYLIWTGIHSRCNNPNVINYARYGGRGIKVCERWKRFENFYADMGPRPSPKHTIDRINNDGDYEPTNCRWATYGEQARNKSSQRMLTFSGATKTMSEWSRELGIPTSTIWNRLMVSGWPVERALTEKVHRR